MIFSGQKISVAELVFKLIAILAIVLALGVLLALIYDVLSSGFGRLSYKFLSSFPSRFAEKAGILSALAGSFYLMILTAAIAVPVGVSAAIYLEEYAGKNWFTRLIELNIANLAGVPSIIYGLLGLQLFARYAGLGRSLIAGALTLSLLVLPVIIIATREALRTVPKSIREGSLALGATKWQTIWCQVLPVALPGILTGCILSMSRAIGETAPLVTLGALTYVAFVPDGLTSAFTALPIQIFNWTSRPQEAFHANAAAGILVLLIVLLCMNSFAIWLRARFQKKLR
ncbi:phosphate ABC transporter permease PstA [bacterium]|nr:phosphate ABC transporter permease PstA [bacterium]